jgi:hypothetical protein
MVDGKIFISGNWDDVLPEIDEMIEAGVESAAVWKKNTIKYVQTVGGWNSIFAQKNVMCAWLFSDSEFVGQQALDDCASVKYEDVSNSFAIGFDISYRGTDASVATLVDSNKNVISMKVIRECNSGAVSIEEQCRRLSLWIEGFPTTISSRIVSMGVDATGVGFAAKEIMEKLLPYPIKEFGFTVSTKMEWYVFLRDSIVSDSLSSRIRFNRDGVLGFDSSWVKDLFHELTSLCVTVSRSGYLMFAAPASGIIMGKSLNDDYVASLAIALDTIGSETGFYNYVAPRKSTLTVTRWGEDLSVSAAGSRIAKLRRLASRGCDPFATVSSSESISSP